VANHCSNGHLLALLIHRCRSATASHHHLQCNYFDHL
jgi:hypothetical protein